MWRRFSTMPTSYHLHVAGVDMLQKCEVDYQHGTEPTRPLPESASPGCRLPILCSRRPSRTDKSEASGELEADDLQRQVPRRKMRLANMTGHHGRPTTGQMHTAPYFSNRGRMSRSVTLGLRFPTRMSFTSVPFVPDPEVNQLEVRLICCS